MSDYTIKEFDVKGLKVKIVFDPDPQNPREWDHLGKMVCFHKRYTLGDKHSRKPEDYSGWGELRDALIEQEGAVLILPLFLYDHGGLRMKVGSFEGLLPQGHAEFDSGQVGFIYVTREAVLKEYKVRNVSKAVLKRGEAVLMSEVDTYDQFLRGDVYRYEIEDEGGNVVDSCGGFYGLDYCKGEARSSAEAIAKKEGSHAKV